MKKIIVFIYFISSLFFALGQENKDSITNSKNNKFMLGISLSPNYSWRNNKEEKQYGGYITSGNTKDETPAFGYSILLSEKITIKQFMFHIGAGLSIYNYKGSNTSDLLTPPPFYRYYSNWDYKHLLINIPIGYYYLLGGNKLWYIGPNIDISYIVKLHQIMHRQTYDLSSNSFVYDNISTYDFTNTQFVIWGGFEIGRTIRVTKWLIIDSSINAKYSTKINTKVISEYPDVIITHPHSLMSLSINITFYPVYKSK